MYVRIVKTYLFLTIVSISFLHSHSAYCQKDRQNQPNIIIILADDLGYGDLSAYGGDISTPNIDRLAREGLRFTDFHSNGASCSPTRAALLTGRYQQRMGVEGALGEHAEGLGGKKAENEITIASYLNDAGYKTGITGKWHLGYNLEQSPIYFGFDEFIGMLHGATDYHSHINTYGRFDWWRNETPVKEDGYITDLVTNHSVELIEKWENKPFFLLVSHLAIHFPWQIPEDRGQREEGKRYRDVSGPLNKLGPHPPEKTGKVVRRMIEELDKSVGLIISKLLELDLDKRTLVFFLSDNGSITEYRGGYTEISSNDPLRGAKHSLYEGGHRVPAIAWWPGMIKAGSTTDETGMTMDILPTLLDLTNTPLPDHKSINSVDGISLAPVLFDNLALLSRTVFWKNGNEIATRSDDWKLILPGADIPSQLYNIGKDVSEEHNIADKYPEIVNYLSGQAESWIHDVLQ